MRSILQFASRPRTERPELRIPRNARRETVEIQLDLEKLLAAAVLEQYLLIRSLAPEILEAARQAFSLTLPGRVSIFDFRFSPIFVERIAKLLAASRVLGMLQVRRGAGLPLTTRQSPLANDLQFGELDKVKPERAIQYLQALAPMERAKWEQLVAAQRSRAFTIAGVHQQSLLEGMKNLIADSLERGISLDQFVKDANDMLHSFQISASRLRTVWNTNVGSALARGREEELADPEVAALIPYRLFDAMNDQFTRPNHAAGDNGVAPAEWWDSEGAELKPLLGFNCRCVLLGITRTRARKMIEDGSGIDLTAGVPAGFYADAGFGKAA